jgi:hypothetical protein
MNAAPTRFPPSTSTYTLAHPGAYSQRPPSRSSSGIGLALGIVGGGVLLAVVAGGAVFLAPRLLQPRPAAAGKASASPRDVAPHALVASASEKAMLEPSAPVPVVRRSSPKSVAQDANAADDGRGPATRPPVAAFKPPAAALPAAAPNAPAPPATQDATTGILRLPDSIQGILVDGVPQSVVGGAVTLRCGKHLLQLPHELPRQVDLPCTKPATL